ncbi:hypothetical protein FGIG_08199 [Fasciola gigantica]|uniref:Uncharacterized protein n=1 Tax=Fasciola gigantica TaxID=46835 RepID=A0A504YDS5_FASGI|nr:hypothetical protein FGIG_08199 [Fasciola gigantica]
MFVNIESLVLSWPDYITFVAVLLLHATVRIFIYSKPFIRRRLRWFHSGNSRWSLDENEMSMLTTVEEEPLSTSLGTTTLILFVTVYTVSTEAYGNGTQLLYLLLAHLLVSVFMAHFYMPLFHELEMNNIHEFLQMAFLLCIPALSLAQLTAYPLWLAVLLTGVMVASYVGAGHFQLSLPMNIIQIVLAIIAPILILAFGATDVGGLSTLWGKVKEGKLITFGNFNPSPFTDYSFFTLMFGGMGVLLSISAVNPIEIEQYSSTIIQKKARIGIYVRMLVQWLFFILLLICGLTGFAILFGCNTQMIELSSHADQMLAVTVVVLGSQRQALKGFLLGALFVVCFGATTSLSYSASTMLARDILASSVKLSFSRYTPRGIGRWVAPLLCLLCIPVSFGLLLIPTSMFRSSLSFAGALGGPLFTTVCLGMFLPCISNLGAFCGLLSSQLFGIAVLFFKIYSYATSGRALIYHDSVDSCDTIFPIRSSSANSTAVVTAPKFSYLGFSFWYIPAMCFIVGLISSLIMSIPAMPVILLTLEFNSKNPVEDRYLAWPARKLFRRGGHIESNLISDSEVTKRSEKHIDESNWSASTLQRTQSSFASQREGYMN